MGIENYGKFVESDLIGVPKKASSYENPFEYEAGLKNLDTYAPRQVCIEDIKNRQYGNPEQPRFPFPRIVLEDLKSDPSVKISEDMIFKFFTALDSPLDRYHGIDGFVEVYSEETGFKTIVTLDVTTNSQKDSYKADVVVMLPRGGIDPREEKDSFLEMSHRYASEVKDILLTKMEKYANFKKAKVHNYVKN